MRSVYSTFFEKDNMGTSTDAILAFGCNLGEEIDENKLEVYETINDKIEIIWHCSCDVVMAFLAIKGTEIRASRGYPENVPFLPYDQNWPNVLDKALKDLGLEFPLKYGWYVFSMWC